VSEDCKSLNTAIETVIKTLISNKNVGDIKTKNGYKVECKDYMDYKITGLICSDGNYGRFEIQFILKGILDFKKYAHRA